MVTKPCVKELTDHIALAEAAKAKGVLVQVEVHKRFDPIYVDARDRIKVSAVLQLAARRPRAAVLRVTTVLSG